MVFTAAWSALSRVRLDSFLRTHVSEILGRSTSLSEADFSNSRIRRLIVAGAVSVDGRQCRVPSFLLPAGSRVSVRMDEEKFAFARAPADVRVTLSSKDILFEDGHIIVVNKMPFIPTEETVVKGRPCVHAAVVEWLWSQNPSLRNPPYAGTMHRLDRETSGVLLFTKSREANASLHAQFEEHSVRKVYRAVCTAGGSVPETFFVDMSMGRVSAKSARCKMGRLPAGKGGLPSHTDFRIVRQKEGLLYVDAFPRTGRTHQIRLHLASRGLPIVGDSLYGGAPGLPEYGGRVMLHASSLSFVHPVLGGRMTVEAPLPEGMQPS